MPNKTVEQVHQEIAARQAARAEAVLDRRTALRGNPHDTSDALAALEGRVLAIEQLLVANGLQVDDPLGELGFAIIEAGMTP